MSFNVFKILSKRSALKILREELRREIKILIAIRVLKVSCKVTVFNLILNIKLKVGFILKLIDSVRNKFVFYKI